jgi:GNAT superfamily N-acetyltransferase
MTAISAHAATINAPFDTAAMLARFTKLPAPSPADELSLEDGTLNDYRALASFHYRGAKPGAVTSVLRLVHQKPTIIGRYLSRKDETQTAGVLVRTLPHMACALRDVATGGRYIGLTRTERAMLLNREIRTISRVVIDPKWRGLGLAVRLVRRALERPEPQMRYTEALAAMGRVHPFFERAGMVRYDRPPLPLHARLLDALQRLDIEPILLASPVMVLDRLERCDDREQIWFEHELARWYRAASRRHVRAGEEPGLEVMLAAARDRVLTLPVYYLAQHDA